MNADECEVNFSLEPADGEQSIPVDRIPSSLVLISVSRDYMHTNDMFVSLNGVRLYRGSVFYSDGLDAGSEENNVRVSRGPPQHQHTTNIESGNGDPRGIDRRTPWFPRVSDLLENLSDRRNPTMKVHVY